MEDLPVGSEIVLKVVKTEKEQCNGCFFDEICNNIYENVCGYFYEENGNTYIIENRQKESKLNRNPTYQVDPSTVCQFTGLKDSEGKEIWEGDIVHDSYDLLCIDNLYEVVYIEEEGAFAFKSLDKVDNYEPFVNLLEAYVVGNKFDKEK